jgi:hypothetical protein
MEAWPSLSQPAPWPPWLLIGGQPGRHDGKTPVTCCPLLATALTYKYLSKCSDELPYIYVTWLEPMDSANDRDANSNCCVIAEYTLANTPVVYYVHAAG